MADPNGTKVAVIYYSSTGHVHTLATAAAGTAEKLGADVRLRRVAETAPREAVESNEQWAAHLSETDDVQTAEVDDLVWADVVLLGTPTRYGNVASQLQSLIDTTAPQWQEGALADKVYAGFTSTATEHGGQESTLLSLYTTIHHWGGIVVSPGYTDPSKFVDGNPYGVGHVSGGDGSAEVGDTARTAVEHLATRAVTVGAALKSGLAG